MSKISRGKNKNFNLFLIVYFCILWLGIIPFRYIKNIGSIIDKFLSSHFSWFFLEWITTIIALIAVWLVYIIPIVAQNIFFKTKKSKEELEKDAYFNYNISSSCEASDLSKNNKFEESNKIYRELLIKWYNNRGLHSIIYAKIWWNYIEMGNFEEAEKCFEKWIELDSKNELIQKWINHISWNEISNKQKYAERRKIIIKFQKVKHFIESIEKATILSKQNKYEESNKIYDELLSYQWEKEIKHYFSGIFANKWWNHIELGQFDLAKDCFEEWLKNNDWSLIKINKLIHDWINYINKSIKS
jgi:tetratricopeptide (TPR) repeat protein